MMLELNKQECRLIRLLVDREIGDLGSSIHHTMSSKDVLKEEKQTLQDIMAKLEQFSSGDYDSESVPSGDPRI